MYDLVDFLTCCLLQICWWFVVLGKISTSLRREPDGPSPWPLPSAISIQGSCEALARYPQPDVFYFSVTVAKWQLMSSTMSICLNLWSMKCGLLKYKYHPLAESSPCAFIIQSFFFIRNHAIILEIFYLTFLSFPASSK